ncbi:hypothetical protein ACFVXG_40820 [Kitasatospora sp. NPDC058162]|uniref:hypothetical protein n=1 Tax=Kitasatospora sp. NPDC058162 TaxID=3346362 RepID=UPI0036DD056D
MTSLHPRSTDSALPGPPADGAGSSPRADALGPPGSGAPICAIATAPDAHAAVAPGVPARGDSVPQPRSPEDVEAQLRRAATGGAATDGASTDTATTGGAATDRLATDAAATAARLREAFADRLRAARAEGRSVAELAAACRRPVEEVRALLGETAEKAEEKTAEVAGPGFVGLRQPAAPTEGTRPTSAPRSAREELRSLGSRRPSPSRRLRRMHPLADPTGQEAAARETAATDPTGIRPHGAGWAGAPAGATGVVTGHLAALPPALAAHGADSANAWAGDGARAVAGDSRAEPPLGILIGGSPVQPDGLGRPEERTPVRVAAEPIRVGRGTSLVVLPSWRPAIAVSVSTEQLVAETGLTVEQLAHAQLTVRMNPWALHDRELDLHGWEPGPAGPTGRARRGGRG